MKHGRTRKERRLDKAHVYEQYETKTPKQQASEWFNRKPYTIRGDTIGQTKTESVQSSAKGDTKT